MYRSNSSGDALSIIETALAHDFTTTTNLDTNFFIGMRSNYFRDLAGSQRGESFVDEMEGPNLFLNRPKVLMSLIWKICTTL